MAIMIPDIPAEDISNDAERLVYKALKNQLPEDHLVRFHYPVCWDLDGYLKEFEVDFIVMAPGKGLMFIEVKGSKGWDCERGIWYRITKDGEREVARNPFEQASKAKHEIVEKLAKRIFRVKKHQFPGITGHLVIYPKGKIAGRLPDSVDPLVLVNRAEMKNLGEIVQNSFAKWGPVERASEFNIQKMKWVSEFFEDNCRFVQVLASKVDEDEERIQELTRSQYVAFRYLLKMNRVTVSGAAGSGKTMIAQWVANEFCTRGERVLFLCYNKTLEEWLKLSTPEGIERVPEFRSFFSICREYILLGKKSFNVPSSQIDQNRFWEESVPDLFFEIVTSLPEQHKFDSIIVDEAQDFHEDWWPCVQMLLKDSDKGGLFIFRDPNQAGVYGHGESYPSKNVFEVDLGENCRNTQAIGKYCCGVIDKEIPSHELSPFGTPPEVNEPVLEHGHRAMAVKHAVKNLIREGFRPSQIAILSLYKKDHSASTLRRIEKVDNFSVKGQVQNLGQWRDDGCIWGSTIKSFKGLEADCVIITDIFKPSDSGSFNFSDLYVACSRARHKLLLFPQDSDARDYLYNILLPVIDQFGNPVSS